LAARDQTTGSDYALKAGWRTVRNMGNISYIHIYHLKGGMYVISEIRKSIGSTLLHVKIFQINYYIILYKFSKTCTLLLPPANPPVLSWTYDELTIHRSYTWRATRPGRRKLRGRYGAERLPLSRTDRKIAKRRPGGQRSR